MWIYGAKPSASSFHADVFPSCNHVQPLELLHLHQLTLGHRGHTLFTAPEAVLPSGALTLLLGRNGVGKSTLLRALVGLHPPAEGCILLDGQPADRLSAPDRARRIALVLSTRVTHPTLRVRELVALGRIPHTTGLGGLTPADDAAVAEALDCCGVRSLADRRILTLSDGETQRVMLARALAQNTPLLLLDEPTAFLDYPAKRTILALLRDVAHTKGKAILLSTHDLDIALPVADRLWLIDGGVLHEGASDNANLHQHLVQSLGYEAPSPEPNAPQDF